MPVNPQKRAADSSALIAVPQSAKKSRNDELVLSRNDKQLIEIGVRRTSNLFSPIMKLEGHESDIFTCEFNPDGEYLGKGNFQASN
jgi:Prp8 binding protein